MTLQEHLAELMGLNDPTAVVKGLQDHAHSIYQLIYDAGHGQASGEAETKRKKLQTDLDTATAELEKLKAKKPEAGSEAAWQKEKEGYENEIVSLKQQVKDAKSEAAETVKVERHARAMNDLKTRLIAAHVDEDMADVLVSKAENAARVQIGEDGTVKVLQAGKTIPYAPSDGKSPLDLLTEELFAKVDKKFIKVTGDRGGGQQNGGAGGGGASYLQTLKDDLVKQREAEAKSPTQTLDERLAGRLI